MCVRGAPLQDRHALHVLLHAIEEVVHVSFVRQAEAPALALQVPQIGLSAQHRALKPTRLLRYATLKKCRQHGAIKVECGINTNRVPTATPGTRLSPAATPYSP